MDAEQRQQDPQSPIYGVYAYNQPREPVRLYEGRLGGITDTDHYGVVELSCTSKPRLRWEVDAESDDLVGPLDPFKLVIHRNDRRWDIDSFRQEAGGGWINFAEYYSEGAQLDRVVAHWINLPNLPGNASLVERHSGGTTTWNGRWILNVEGWRIVIDRRRDHSAAFNDLHADDIYVVTHVMEIRRTDGSCFAVAAAKALLENLRVAISFALGRWVAPTLPVGSSESGDVVWESWWPPICDPAAKVGQGWLYYHSQEDLEGYLLAALKFLKQDGQNGPLRFQMVCAVQACHAGFLEQRITAAFGALENIAWLTLVLGKRVQKADYGNSKVWPGERRLREILALASIPPDLAGFDLPALEEFARKERAKDGPSALVRVRNRLVHPKSPRDEVYHIPNLALDAWYLSRYYLNLLILHAIGYEGEITTHVPPFGWFGETHSVPWSSPDPPKSEFLSPPRERNVGGTRPSAVDPHIVERACPRVTRWSALPDERTSSPWGRR